MAFNPDAYLASKASATPSGSFDPDSYLASKQSSPIQSTGQPLATEKNQGIGAQLLGGIIEPLVAMGTGAIAKPVSDIAGLAATAKEVISPTPGGGDPADFKKHVQEAMTFQPITAAGQSAYNPLNFIPRAIAAPVQSGAEWLGKVVGQDAGGDTMRGAIGHGVQEAAMQLPGLVGIKGAGKLAATAKESSELPLSLKQQVFKEGRDYGYVATPTAVGKKGAAFESITNKNKITAKTSIKNAEARAQDIRRDLYLDEGTQITPAELEAVRNSAYQKSAILNKELPEVAISRGFKDKVISMASEYSALKSKFPSLIEGPTQKVLSNKLNDLLKNDKLPTSDIIEVIRNLRQQAKSDLSAPVGSQISPLKKSNGEFSYHLANNLEGLIEENLADNPVALQNFRDARTTIAKTYDVEASLNPATGEVSGPKLARLYDSKKDVLTGGLKRAAEQARAFPSDHRDVSKLGGHAPLSYWDLLIAGGTAVGGHPGVAAAEVGGRVGIPSMLASDWYQNRLLNAPSVPNLQGLAGTASLTSQIPPPPQNQ